ncbi:MAG: helix-turn-helix transcriptional regulator, partial [Pseudomonadota bacterium]
NYTMLDPGSLFRIIEDRRRSLGISQIELSRRAFGPDADNSALQNLRRGSVPSAVKLERLAEATGLEFYFGEPRDGANADPTRQQGSPAENSGFQEMAGIFEMAEPDEDGWSSSSQDLPGSTFFLQLTFDVEAIRAGAYLMVEPLADLQVEDLVFIEDSEGRVSIGRFDGETEKGWYRFRRNGSQMIDERAPQSLRRVLPITWTGRTPPPPAFCGALAQTPDQRHFKTALNAAKLCLEDLSKTLHDLEKGIET